MLKKMKLVRPALFAALLCGASAVSALAQQDAVANPASGAPGPLTTPPPLLPPPPTAQHRQGRPPMPLFDALDTNHDGIISAEEIANASASLKTLLKNGSDHLTRDDLRPAGAPSAAAGGPGRPVVDENAQPRPKIGAIRPHGPPHQQDEDLAPPTEAPRVHPPAPDDRREADANFDHPRFRDEWMHEQRRFFRMREDEMDDARATFRHERMSRREHPFHAEDGDQANNDMRPARRELAPEDQEARLHHAPRPENAEMPEHIARPQPRHAMLPSPLFNALDTNHDGVISAEEIANAPAILKGLLKNGSDHLTRDDLRAAAAPPQAIH